jgi:hypothetical protein
MIELGLFVHLIFRERRYKNAWQKEEFRKGMDLVEVEEQTKDVADVFLPGKQVREEINKKGGVKNGRNRIRNFI